MSIADIPELQKLTPQEKFHLIDELWCSLKPDDVAHRDELNQALRERIEREERDPSCLIPLDEFKRRWAARKK